MEKKQGKGWLPRRWDYGGRECGAEHIGETIKAQVLSVKHTSSGRMIFCNSTDEGLLSDQESAANSPLWSKTHKTFVALDSSKYSS